MRIDTLRRCCRKMPGLRGSDAARSSVGVAASGEGSDDSSSSDLLETLYVRREPKGGGGGTWRAWVRIHCNGTQGRPDLAALGESYRLAKRGGGDRLMWGLTTALAEISTRIHSRSDLPHSSFGDNASYVKRVSVRKIHERLLTQIRPRPK